MRPSTQENKHVLDRIDRSGSQYQVAVDTGESLEERHLAELELEIELYRRAEMAIEFAHQEFLALFECAPVGYFLLDAVGTVRRVNRRGCEALGLIEDALLGRRFATLVSPSSVETVSDHLDAVMRHKKREPCHVDLQRSDGTTFRARLRGERAPASRTSCEGVFLIADDIDDLIALDVAPPLRSAPLRSGYPRSAERASGLGRVLVVDDEELILKATARVLKRMGYEVFGYTSPEEALEGFAANPATYQAIISDFRMPTMNGIQLCERFASLRNDVPILLLSGHIGEIDPVRAKEVGIERVLSKPIAAEELSSWLAAAMAASA